MVGEVETKLSDDEGAEEAESVAEDAEGAQKEGVQSQG